MDNQENSKVSSSVHEKQCSWLVCRILQSDKQSLILFQRYRRAYPPSVSEPSAQDNRQHS